jgi:hypothetical protein
MFNVGYCSFCRFKLNLDQNVLTEVAILFCLLFLNIFSNNSAISLFKTLTFLGCYLTKNDFLQNRHSGCGVAWVRVCSRHVALIMQ